MVACPVIVPVAQLSSPFAKKVTWKIELPITVSVPDSPLHGFVTASEKTTSPCTCSVSVTVSRPAAIATAAHSRVNAPPRLAARGTTRRSILSTLLVGCCLPHKAFAAIEYSRTVARAQGSGRCSAFPGGVDRPHDLHVLVRNRRSPRLQRWFERNALSQTFELTNEAPG